MVLVIKLLIGCLFFDKQTRFLWGQHLVFHSVLQFSAGSCPRRFVRWIAVQSVYNRYLPAPRLLSILTRSLLLRTGAAEGWKFKQPEWVFTQGFKSHQMLKKLVVNPRLENSVSSVLLRNSFVSSVSVSFPPSPHHWSSELAPWSALLWGCRGNRLLEARFCAYCSSLWPFKVLLE